MSKVSIIIPVYNVEKYLDKCLKSVLNQTYKNIEIIVINDGSTDNSLKICKKYKDKRIVLIDKENGGVSSARNKGLQLASGKYITFVDSDYWLELDAIENMVSFIEKENADLVRFCYQTADVRQNSVSEAENKYIGSEIARFTEKLISGEMPGYLHILMVKREVIKDIKFKTDLPLAEDLIFVLELLKNVNSISMSNVITYNYLENLDSASRSIKHYRRNIHNELMLNKYINEIYDNKYERLSNARCMKEAQIYLLKMYRDGYDINEVKEEFDFFVDDEYFNKIRCNIDESILNKRDKKIFKYISNKQFDKMIKYFKSEINKSIINYKYNRIKLRLKEMCNGNKKTTCN